MRLKKILLNSALGALVLGASVTLGLLSFGGIFVLWPVLAVASGFFVLSVAFEAEIYFQNIKGSFDELYKRDYLKTAFAKEFLNDIRKEFKQDSSLSTPLFYDNYQKQAAKVNAYTHRKLTQDEAEEYRREEKELRDMEKWFTSQLFETPFTEKRSLFSRNLQAWLKEEKIAAKHEALKKRDRAIDQKKPAIKIFSVAAGLFTGAGTAYSLIELFSVFPILAGLSLTFWPLIIVPTAILAGAAYGYLTYWNAIALLKNDTYRYWKQKFHDYCAGELNARKVLIIGLAFVLLSLAVTLTVCTAGTWLTIVKETSSLFSWMGGKAAWIIMGIINPIVEAISALAFNIKNALDSLKELDEKINPEEKVQVSQENKTMSWRQFFNPIHRTTQLYESLRNRVVSFRDFIKELRKTESWGQILNPFRWLASLYEVIRQAAFAAHIISISVISDRAPGIPTQVSIPATATCELAEDWPYVGRTNNHHHAHDIDTFLEERLGSEAGHNHNENIPSWLLNKLFYPIYGIAALVDCGWSQFYRKPLSLKESWNRMSGQEEEHEHHSPHKNNLPSPSEAWREAYALDRIRRFKRSHPKIEVEDSAVSVSKTGLTGLKFFDKKNHAPLKDEELLPLLLKQTNRYFSANG